MTALPDIRRIQKGDLDNPDENLMKVVDAVNRFMETTYDALTGLTFEENFASQEKDINAIAATVGTGKYPISVKHGMTKKITGVNILRVQRTDTGYFVPIGSSVGIDWRQDGLDLIIEDFPGLDFTTGEERYTIKVLVV